MAAAVEQLRIKEDEVLVGCDLFRAAEGAKAKRETFDGVAFVKAQGKKGGSIAAILQQALVSRGKNELFSRFCELFFVRSLP